MSGPQQAVDPRSVLHSLGIDDATDVAPVTGGADTAIWKVDRAGVSHALRLFRRDEAETCRREREAMRAAAAGGVPVPEIQAEGVWEGRPVLLLSWCPGRPVLRELLARPWRAGSIGAAFGRTQAAIHAVPAPPSLLSPPWYEWKGPHSPELIARLGEVSRGGALLHLDYHILNVMMEDCRVTGVLDWANARGGDPRADVARTASILQLDMGQLGRPGYARVLDAALGALWGMFSRGWLRGYQEIAGPLTGMAPFYAWAGEAMQHDLAHRYSERQLEPVRRWTESWLGRMREG